MLLIAVEGADEASAVGESVGFGDGMALLCIDGLLDGISVGEPIGW